MHKPDPAGMVIKTEAGLGLQRFREVIIQAGTILELQVFKEVVTAEMPGLH